MIIFGKEIRNRYLLLGDIFLSLVSVLASFAPARRASQISVREALAYE